MGAKIFYIENLARRRKTFLFSVLELCGFLLLGEMIQMWIKKRLQTCFVMP